MECNEMNVRSAERFDNGLNNLGFDYDSVSQSVAKFLRGQADQIRRQCTKSIIQMGKALLEAKHHLSHGGFLRWVEWEVGMPVRTAQAYMRVACWASDKGATVAHLSPSTLYVLSAASTPRQFVTDILNRAEAGEHVPPSVMRRELKALQLSEPRPRTEIRAQREPRTHLKAEIVTSEPGGVAELAAILLKGLSPIDLARVRDIVTSDTVFSDSQLARNLERAFERAMHDQEYVALVPEEIPGHVEPLRRRELRSSTSVGGSR
jgi:hypothetical protein